jgi:hypothetical protein
MSENEQDSRPRWLRPQAPGGKAPAHWDRNLPTAPSEHATAQPPPAAAPPPPTAPTAVAHGGYAPPGQAPPSAPYPPMPPPAYAPASNDQATAGLILGIVGLSVVVLGAGIFFFVSLPCSILAWVFGARAKARLERGETLAGGTQAQAAFVLGIIGVALAALGVLVWVVLIVVGSALDGGGNQDALSAAAGAVRALAALPG